MLDFLWFRTCYKNNFWIKYSPVEIQVIVCIKNRVFNKQHEIWEPAPTVHITASKGSSPGPCALCVRRENLTHKGNWAKVFTFHFMVFFLVMQTWFLPWQILETESISKNAKNSVEQYSLFRKTCLNVLKIFWLVTAVFLWKKYAYSWSSASGKGEHIIPVSYTHLTLPTIYSV